MRNKKQLTQYGIIVGLAVLVVVAIILFMKMDSAYKMPSDGFQIVAGEKKVFDKGTSFVYGDEGSTYKGAEKNEYLNGTAIYFDEDKQTVVLPRDEIYVNGRQAIFKKVLGFKEVNNKSGIFYDDVNLDGGFIYDGNNSYIFLEDMTVNVNGKDIKVGALSSIDVSESGTYFLYNTKDGKISVDRLYTTSCDAKCNDYSIDLLNDIFYTANNDKVLLYTKVDSLDELKK